MTEENHDLTEELGPVVEDDWEWCIIVGESLFIDDLVYKAIAARKNVDILFREHVVIKEGSISTQYDLLMLNGVRELITNFEELCKDDNSIFIRVSIDDVLDNPNLIVLIAPDKKILYLSNILTKLDVEFTKLKTLESATVAETGFASNKSFTRRLFSTVNELLDLDDVILNLVLVSVKKEADLKKVENIASSNQIFVIDFKDINI